MSKRRGVTAALLLSAAFAVSSPALADSMRCENRLLKEGDTKYDARALCGPPDAEEHRVERRRVRHQISVPCPGGQGRRCTSMVEDTVEVPIEVWTYDFGPQRFVQYVIFENDKVVRIESGKYGHKRS